MRLSEEIRETAKEAGIYGNWLEEIADKVALLEKAVTSLFDLIDPMWRERD